MLQVAEGEFVAEVEIRLAVMDSSGKRSDIPAIPVRFERSGAAVEGEMVEYSTVLKMRAKPHDLAVAVYEPASGRIFSALTQVGP